MLGLVFRPKHDVRLNDVDGAMARSQALASRVGEYGGATAVRPLVAGRVCAGASQWQHAVCRPRDAGTIEGRCNRRGAAVSVGVSGSRSAALLGSPVGATALRFERASRVGGSGAARAGRLLAHSLLM